MASGTRQMKVRPADLLRHLQGRLHCKWQRPPQHCAPLPSLLRPARRPQKWSCPGRGAPPPEPRAAGTLTSSNDLQPLGTPEELHIPSHVHLHWSIKRKLTSRWAFQNWETSKKNWPTNSETEFWSFFAFFSNSYSCQKTKNKSKGQGAGQLSFSSSLFSYILRFCLLFLCNAGIDHSSRWLSGKSETYLCSDKFENEDKWIFGMYEPPPLILHGFVVWTSGLQAFVGTSAPLRRGQTWDATETGDNCDRVVLLSPEIQTDGGGESLPSHQAKGNSVAVRGQPVNAAVMVGEEPSMINDTLSPDCAWKVLVGGVFWTWGILLFWSNDIKSRQFECNFWKFHAT